jgi:hypothetical protein
MSDVLERVAVVSEMDEHLSAAAAKLERDRGWGSRRISRRSSHEADVWDTRASEQASLSRSHEPRADLSVLQARGPESVRPDGGVGDVHFLSALANEPSPPRPPQAHPMPAQTSVAPLGVSQGLPLLPPLDVLDPVPSHRLKPATAERLAALYSEHKFRDRFAILVEQLTEWGYFDCNGRTLSSKHAFAAFGRENPDLLYALPPQKLHILTKKFKPLPAREVIRRVRLAGARLIRLYVDFQSEPFSHVGAPSFLDLTRLVLFVATSNFPHIEAQAPGIVAAASDIIPSMLLAASQPPLPGRRREHSNEWHALQASLLTTAQRKSRFREDGKRLKQRCATHHTMCRLLCMAHRWPPSCCLLGSHC